MIKMTKDIRRKAVETIYVCLPRPSNLLVVAPIFTGLLPLKTRADFSNRFIAF